MLQILQKKQNLDGEKTQRIGLCIFKQHMKYVYTNTEITKS